MTPDSVNIGNDVIKTFDKQLNKWYIIKLFLQAMEIKKKYIFFKYRVTDRVFLLQSSKRFQRFFSRLQPNEGLPIACSMGS